MDQRNLAAPQRSVKVVVSRGRKLRMEVVGRVKFWEMGWWTKVMCT